MKIGILVGLMTIVVHGFAFQTSAAPTLTANDVAELTGEELKVTPAKIPCSDTKRSDALKISGIEFCSITPVEVAVSPSQTRNENCDDYDQQVATSVCTGVLAAPIAAAVSECSGKAIDACNGVKASRQYKCETTPDPVCPPGTDTTRVCKTKEVVANTPSNQDLCPGEKACSVSQKKPRMPSDPGIQIPQNIARFLGRNSAGQCRYSCGIALGNKVNVSAEGQKCFRCNRGCSEQ